MKRTDNPKEVDVKTIKRYVDGRFFDMQKKRFVKRDALADMIRRGDAVKILQSRSGADVTDDVAAELVPERQRRSAERFLTKELKRHYLRYRIRLRRHLKNSADGLLQGLQLASRQQVSELSTRVGELSRMVQALEDRQRRQNDGAQSKTA